jgi:hypothetical protein
MTFHGGCVIPNEQRSNTVIRQIKVWGLSVLAVFAVGMAVSASASASAHAYFVCKEGGTEKFTEHLCATEGETGKWSFSELKGTEKSRIEGTSGVLKLETNLYGGFKSQIECKKGEYTGYPEIGGEGVGTAVPWFYECALYQRTTERQKVLAHGCSVGTVYLALKDKLVTGEGGFGTEEEFSAESGSEFGVFTIGGTECVWRGEYRLTSQEGKPAFVCALLEAAVGKVEHEIVCSSSGSNISIARSPAVLYDTQKVKLVGGASWAAE